MILLICVYIYIFQISPTPLPSLPVLPPAAAGSESFGFPSRPNVDAPSRTWMYLGWVDREKQDDYIYIYICTHVHATTKKYI